MFRAMEQAAQSSHVELRSQVISEIAAMAAMNANGAAILSVQPSSFFFRHRNRLIDSAMSLGLATIFP
jgi:uncharacterized alkaline shock family protein YloU